MIGVLSTLITKFFRSKYFVWQIVLIFAAVFIISTHLVNENSETGFRSVPADLVVDNWSKPQVFRIRVWESRSYAVVLDFQIDSKSKREAILKKFSDGSLTHVDSDNIPISFQIEVHDRNGNELIKQSVKTKNINFFSNDTLGRLIDSFNLEVGDYIMTLRLEGDQVPELNDTTVRITYLTK